MILFTHYSSLCQEGTVVVVEIIIEIIYVDMTHA